jgi:hypothetical protein
VTGKRLFWLSIIIVELALVYFLWKPYRHQSTRASHRTAPIPSAVQRAEVKQVPSVVESRKPTPIIHAHGPWRRKSIVVNAGLKSPEPIPATPSSSIAPRPLSSLDSFWCHISMMDSTCDCKGKNDERSANLLTQ